MSFPNRHKRFAFMSSGDAPVTVASWSGLERDYLGHTEGGMFHHSST